jgi:hypothetical protein
MTPDAVGKDRDRLTKLSEVGRPSPVPDLGVGVVRDLVERGLGLGLLRLHSRARVGG